MTKKTLNRFSPEIRRRAVRMVLNHGGDHAFQWAAIGSTAVKIGCTVETRRLWVRRGERDAGHHPGAASEERIENIAKLAASVQDEAAGPSWVDNAQACHLPGYRFSPRSSATPYGPIMSSASACETSS
jgi:transposase